MMLTLSIPSSLSTMVGGLPFVPGISTCLVLDNMMYRDTSWTGIMTAIYVTVHPTHVSERYDQRKCVWTPKTVTLCNILRVGLHSGSIEITNFGLLASLVNRTLSFQLTACVEHHSRNSLPHHCPSRKLKLKRFKLKIPLLGVWVSPFWYSILHSWQCSQLLRAHDRN